MFLSLKKHLEESPSDLANALLQFCHLLLRSIRLHSIRGEEAETHRFQTAVMDLERRLGESPTAQDVLIIAGEVSRVYEDFCHHTNRFLLVQSAELGTMISMLTATVSTISSASQRATEQLARVEKRIENVSYSSDLPRLKAELADCLAMVREEAFRQREQTAETIHSLQRGVSDSRKRLEEASGTEPALPRPALFRDPVTNLAGRADAEDALLQARLRPSAYAAVLPVDRLALVHSRFGGHSMDLVLQFFCTYLQKHLQPGDHLFRWSANAFLAVLERTQAPDTVRADLSRFASAKLELMLEHHGREILLPVSSTWALFPAAEGRSHDTLVAKIDAFLRNEMHLKDSF
ncbi:MAG TPA: GGDEF domain-containing protein [Bryobacteraceae bacterium]|nr:GGDEF domain-containing protein [Bryobacteraceae bacterium]